MITPRRGGKHPYVGIYIGGSALNTKYKCVQDRPFHHVSQLRTENQMASNKSNLIQASDDTNIIKLNGQLEMTSGGVAELDRIQFEEVFKKYIQCLTSTHGIIFRVKTESC